jgi:hypothetical protein
MADITPVSSDRDRVGAGSRPDAAWTTASDPSTQDLKDQDNRVFAHAMHEENNLIQRGNYFLVVESMIMVAYSLMLSGRTTVAGGNLAPSVRVVAIFGLVITAIWFYASDRQWRYFKVLRQRCAELLPEYRETRSRLRVGRVSSTPIIAYGIPMITAIMWLSLLITL